MPFDPIWSGASAAGEKCSLLAASKSHSNSVMGDGKPQWNEAFADKLLGSVVLIGLTRRTASGEIHEQFYGTVERADADGVDLCLGGSRVGEIFFLPPDPTAFFPAQPGIYRLHQTDEVIENPGSTTTWTIGPEEG